MGDKVAVCGCCGPTWQNMRQAVLLFRCRSDLWTRDFRTVLPVHWPFPCDVHPYGATSGALKWWQDLQISNQVFLSGSARRIATSVSTSPFCCAVLKQVKNEVNVDGCTACQAHSWGHHDGWRIRALRDSHAQTRMCASQGPRCMLWLAVLGL